MGYLRGLSARFRLLLQKYPFSIPLSLFLLGLIVFSSSAYYNLTLRNKVKARENTITSKNEPESENNKGEIAGTETEISPTLTVKPTSSFPNSNIKSTPTPTEKPSEVKEIHTRETVEEKTIIVVTATPIPTIPPTPMPTSTPTPTPLPTPMSDTRAFEATISTGINGESINATISANKDLSSCQITLCNAGGGLCISGGHINGNICTSDANFQNSTPYFQSASVCSNYGECKSFE